MDSDFLAFYLNAAGGAAENRSALDSPDFDPSAYVDELVRQKSLKEVEQAAEEVHAELLDKEDQLHMVVRRNCSRLASNTSAANEIRDLTEQLQRDLDETLQEYSKFESHVSTLNRALRPSLEQAKAALRRRKEDREFEELQNFCADLEYTVEQEWAAQARAGAAFPATARAAARYLSGESRGVAVQPIGRPCKSLSCNEVAGSLDRFTTLLSTQALDGGGDSGRVETSTQLLAHSLFAYLAALPERGTTEQSALLRGLVPSDTQFTALTVCFSVCYFLRLAATCMSCLQACDEACSRASVGKGRLTMKKQAEIVLECISKSPMAETLREPLLEVQMVMGELGGRGLPRQVLFSKGVYSAILPALSAAFSLAGRFQAADRVFLALRDALDIYSGWAEGGVTSDGQCASQAEECAALLRDAFERAFQDSSGHTTQQSQGDIQLVKVGDKFVLSETTVSILLSQLLRRLSTIPHMPLTVPDGGKMSFAGESNIFASPQFSRSARNRVDSLKAEVSPVVAEFCASTVYPFITTLITSSLDTYRSTMPFAVRATLSFKGCTLPADEGANGLIADSVKDILKKEEQNLSTAFFNPSWFHEIWAEAQVMIEKFAYHELETQILRDLTSVDPPCNRYVSAVVLSNELYRKSFGLELRPPETACSSTGDSSQASGSRDAVSGSESRARQAIGLADADWDRARLASGDAALHPKAGHPEGLTPPSGHEVPDQGLPVSLPQASVSEIAYFVPALRKAVEIGVLRGNPRMSVQNAFFEKFDSNALLKDVEPLEARAGETDGLVRYLNSRLPTCLARVMSNSLRLMAFVADETHGELVYGISDFSYIQERAQWLGPKGWLRELSSLVPKEWFRALIPLKDIVQDEKGEMEQFSARADDSRPSESGGSAEEESETGYAGETFKAIIGSLTTVMNAITVSLHGFSEAGGAGDGQQDTGFKPIETIPEGRTGVIKCLKVAVQGYLGVVGLSRGRVSNRSTSVQSFSEAMAALLKMFSGYACSVEDLEGAFE